MELAKWPDEIYFKQKMSQFGNGKVAFCQSTESENFLEHSAICLQIVSQFLPNDFYGL
jgi:hypothetical protein